MAILIQMARFELAQNLFGSLVNIARYACQTRDVDFVRRSPIASSHRAVVGKPVIKGTRIAVEFVIDLMGRGWSVERILREYDHLTAEDIQACLCYAGETLKSERVYLVPY